ncbi:MAG: carbohydrate binding family 9 domain-containing protein [Acidobacteria bacterium]|nr:carbohydrate binding family 9 domain-containing protein [Acidobacteriota bacterium]
MNVRLPAALALVAALLGSVPLRSETLPGPQRFSVPRATVPVKVDGVLDDEAWKGVTPVLLPFEVNPGENTPALVRTEAFITHDAKALYVGIHAYDPDPKLIRAQYTDRDRAYANDFVGIVLDTYNDERRGFEFFVNPLGVQMDLVQDDTQGGNEDDSWDTLWTSAGRIVADGYVVELAIPFSSLRFRRSETPQTWGVDVLRIYPRNSRYLFRTQPQSRNRNCYVCQFSKMTGFDRIDPGRNIEVSPTVTVHRTDELGPGGGLEPGKWDFDPGLSAKWGITPNLTLNGALNPDFSQIEADSAQLDINTQFALFFPEKRPFFLEGADTFSTPIQAVYTRTIADPDWGAKVTGKQGRSALGLYITRDARTNLIVPGSEGSELTTVEGKSLDTAFRYRYDLGEASNVGVLYTGREGPGYANSVYGADAYVRLTPKDSVSVQVLGSSTKYPEATATEFGQPQGQFGDRAFSFSYRHQTRTFTLRASYTDIGNRFRADSGFVPQVNYRQPVVGGSYTWRPKKAGGFFTRISVGGDWDRTDEEAGGRKLEEEWEGFVEGNGPLQSYLGIGGGTRERSYNGVTFRENFGWAYLEMKPLAMVSLEMDSAFGDQIDFANTQLGTRLFLRPIVTFTPGKHLKLQVDHTLSRLDVPRGRLFTANLTQLGVTWCFDTRFLVRATLQLTDIERNPAFYAEAVDARTKRAFTQLLASYKLNPQTVVFLGYSDSSRGDEHVDLTRESRTLFAKVGYAWVP